MVSITFHALGDLLERNDTAGLQSFLSSHPGSVDDRDETGATPLMVAASAGKLKCLQILINAGADVSAEDHDNWTALHNAAKEGHNPIIKELLKHDPNIEAKDMGGWTSLMWAVYKNHLTCTVMLLDCGADANSLGQHHISCLGWAAGRGYNQIVRELIKYGAKVDIGDKFGTTPLIWACRKGYLEIVSELLEHGAFVDAVGMYSWTPLLVAVKSGSVDVVRELLNHRPNVNCLDKEGHTPLIIVCKDGNNEMAAMLINANAYINLQDRNGDTALIYAARGGHKAIVEMLLKKYAELNHQGKEKKTAVFWAVERGHQDIVKAFLASGSDIEIPNKDGDTPLLKAVRIRNSEIVQLLMDKKAKVSATDPNGDTALHIAIRGRSKKIVEILLRNPKNSKLLYKPNKAGETPYSMDAANEKRLISEVFGARKLNTNEETENRLGYDLYSSALADFLSEPALVAPIAVGLFAKWGSGKSFLLSKLKDEMKNFAQEWVDPVLEFTPLLLVVVLHIALAVGFLFGVAFRSWTVGLQVGGVLAALLIIFLGITVYGTQWYDSEWFYQLNANMAKTFAYMRILFDVTFKHPAGLRSDPNQVLKIRYFFADQTRVSSTGRGDNNILQILFSLHQSFERKCGIFLARLYRAFHPKAVSSSSKQQWRRLCCIPYIIIFLLTVYSMVAAGALLSLFYPWEDSRTGSEVEMIAVEASVITLAVAVCLVLISNLVTLGRLAFVLVFSYHRHLQRSLSNFQSSKSEGYIQALKQEVNFLVDMVRCVDGFTGHQSRLVIIVDGLDSCEQEKVLQTLDIINLLFSDSDTPFIILLSIDPHIIIKAVELNINKIFSDTAITGHDYLRNLIHLPFYLQNTTLRKVAHARQAAESLAVVRESTWYEAETDSLTTAATAMSAAPPVSVRRPSMESNRAHLEARKISRLPKSSSRRKSSESVASSVASNMNRHGGEYNKILLTDDYFSDVNPRSMRRLMNVVYVSGRLMKAFQIDFNWHHLASWINITEQWPYRTAWIIQYCLSREGKLSDKLSLKELYDRVKGKVPIMKDEDPLVELDRDEKKLDVFLLIHRHNLCLGDLKVFLPFTVNLDPYIQKVVKEEYFSDDGHPHHQQNHVTPQADHKTSPLTPAWLPGGIVDNQHPRHRHSTTAVPQPPPPPPEGSHWWWPFMWGNPQQPAPSVPSQPQPPAQRTVGKVALPGSFESCSLGRMSVDDVCRLVGEMKGIRSEAAEGYRTKLQEHNIHGRVLATCDMDELKKVLSMNFGDWETFRQAVFRLREKEEAAVQDEPTPQSTQEPKNVRFSFSNPVATTADESTDDEPGTASDEPDSGGRGWERRQQKKGMLEKQNEFSILVEHDVIAEDD